MRAPIYAFTLLSLLVPLTVRGQDPIPLKTGVASRTIIAQSEDPTPAIQSTIETLSTLLASPAPRGQSRTDIAAYNAHTAWLQGVRDRLQDHLDRRFGSSAGMISEMMELNAEFLELQESVQTEARKFQTLSNASQIRHDAAMNAIRNMKA
ncbi:MAG TPA: hypothetical protein VM778_03060 [Gemmatimonadota bacterium]|nr:hypothetical protein [Gemmatimonadota bacterium]